MKSAAVILQSMGFTNPVSPRLTPPLGRLQLAAPSPAKDSIQRHTQGALDYLVATLRKTW
jgi:hypothetical protein